MRLLYMTLLIFVVISISGCSSKTVEPAYVEVEEKSKIVQIKDTMLGVRNKILGFDLCLGMDLCSEHNVSIGSGLGFAYDITLGLAFDFALEEDNVEDDESFDDLLDEFADETEVKEIYDPFNGYNRAMTTFNDGVYEYILSPVATGYRFVLHREIRKSVDKFFHNAFFPTRFANNLLQGKFYNTYEESARFVLNTTVGILGIFDPAKYYFNLEAHNEDFGQTLGFYGVGSGPHIVLPFIGPSNLRDIVGLVPESFTNPWYYNDLRIHNVTSNYLQYTAVKTYETVNYTSLNIGEYDKLKEDAIDLYPYLRDVYEQYRDKQIEE